MRGQRPIWGIVAALALVTGCGGGNTHLPVGSPTGSPARSAAPVRVLSVSPHHLKASVPITVTYAAALAPESPLPSLHPAVPGAWSRQGSAAVFTPSQAYPPDTPLTVKAARVPGGRSRVVAHATTPRGSLVRAQQILADLHYLPLSTSATELTTPAEQAAAVYDPPPGKFRWRFPNIPSTLRHDWAPGRVSEVMRGAVLAFQHHEHLAPDAAVGQYTWQALIEADLRHDMDPDKYSYVSADLNLPQRLSVWVEGKTELTSPVNGGVAGAPTPLGTYPVYDRYDSTTMSGTNPDGSHYNDPGVPWVSYFSGGSAVHGFPRASYGSPQSVGCLELPIATAKVVYHLISYGTLVHVSGPQSSESTAAKPAAPSQSHGGGSTD